MSNKFSSIRALAKRLNNGYVVTTIDFEPVLYKCFKNGYNVEISGVYTTSRNKKATIYLWDSERSGCRMVKMVSDVAQEDINRVVEELRQYSEIDRNNHT